VAILITPLTMTFPAGRNRMLSVAPTTPRQTIFLRPLQLQIHQPQGNAEAACYFLPRHLVEA
jgi:hypothetical protein